MAFVVTENTLKSITDYKTFKGEFEAYVDSVCEEVRLRGVLFSDRRERDAHTFWCEDIERIKKAELLDNGLDHFKQCGLLAYWLRRTSPVIEFTDYASPVEGDFGNLDKEHEDFKDFLTSYSSEYFAFDWAFRICLFHEQTRPDKNERADRIQLSHEYIRTTCHFLKCKQVSPHAMFLIYRSLFEE
jgi:hypothetical protein